MSVNLNKLVCNGCLLQRKISVLKNYGKCRETYFFAKNYQHNNLLQHRKVYLSPQYLKHTKESKVLTSNVPISAVPVVKKIFSKDLINDKSSKQIDLDSTKLKWSQCPGIYAHLSKWYLSWFVVVTADAGFCLAPTEFSVPLFYAATVGTLLCAFSANSFNQISEVKLDSLMDRTKKRPLVQGIITPTHAKIYAVLSGITGVSCLYFGVNLLTATLGAANIGLYALVYTPLKQLHWFNTWVGSVVGAIPPVMGWTAATGTLDPGAFIFAGILYAWQFPHFFALAWRRRADYARGSYKMLPLSHPYGTRVAVISHTLALCAICAAAPLTGVTSWAFVALSSPLNAWFTYESWRFFRQGNSKSAQKVYKCSLYYIILISCMLVIDRKIVPKIKTQQQLQQHSENLEKQIISNV